MKDKDLLWLLKKDPERGMSILMNEYSALIYSVVKAKLQFSDYYSSDIEDCVADTFIKFYTELKRYDLNMGSIRSYLCVIARNKAIDVLRRRSTEQEYLLKSTAFAEYDEPFSVDEEYLTNELVSEIVKTISQLGMPDGEIIFRKYYLSQSSKEIAEALSMSVSNVNVRIHRVIKELREKFGGKNEK